MALQQRSINLPEAQAEPVVSAQQAFLPGSENAANKAENL